MSSKPDYEPEVLGAAERRLIRLRYDLHDGPQQDLMLLADDLRRLRAELEAAIGGEAERGRVLGHVDELQQRLVSLDADLRRLAAFIESPFLETQSVPDALAGVVEDFTTRSGITPKLKIEGDFSEVSHSQQITILNVIREALSNVREHSQAKSVSITVSSLPEGVDASIWDDGQGFEPEAMLEKASGEGHLGLAGMHERAHLPGGATDTESRPGGPTEGP